MAAEGWVVVFSREGRIKRMPLEAFGMQHRGGKGITGARPGGGDVVDKLGLVGAGEDLLAFTTGGRVVSIPADKVPEMSRYAQGAPVAQVFPLEEGEKVSALLGRGPGPEAAFLCLATVKGVIKRTEAAPLARLRSSGVRVITLESGDEVRSVALSSGEGQILLATRRGKAVRFSEEEVRVSGRDARGVSGVRLEDGDTVVSLSLVDEASMVLTVTELGFGKRTRADDYRKTARGTGGVTNIGDPDKVGPVVAAFTVGQADHVILASEQGKLVRVPVGEVRETGRSASGVRVMRVDDGDRVTAVAPVAG